MREPSGFKLPDQFIGSMFKYFVVRGIAVMTFTKQRNTSILRNNRFQYRLLKIWSVILGIAMCDVYCLLICIRQILSCKRKGGGIEMVESEIDLLSLANKRESSLKRQSTP